MVCQLQETPQPIIIKTWILTSSDHRNHQRNKLISTADASIYQDEPLSSQWSEAVSRWLIILTPGTQMSRMSATTQTSSNQIHLCSIKYNTRTNQSWISINHIGIIHNSLFYTICDTVTNWHYAQSQQLWTQSMQYTVNHDHVNSSSRFGKFPRYRMYYCSIRNIQDNLHWAKNAICLY